MTDIRQAPAALTWLAEEMRPDWNSDVLADALIAAKTAGWTWTHTLRETVRLLCDPNASPDDLRRAAAVALPRSTTTGTAARRVPEYAALREQLAAMKPVQDDQPLTSIAGWPR